MCLVSTAQGGSAARLHDLTARQEATTGIPARSRSKRAFRSWCRSPAARNRRTAQACRRVSIQAALGQLSGSYEMFCTVTRVDRLAPEFGEPALAQSSRNRSLPVGDRRKRQAITPTILAEAARHLLVINASPAGTFPAADTFPAIPYQAVTPDHFFFDLVYNPPKTIFLQKAEEKGASIQNGYDMLVEQAEASWRLWNER